LLASPRTRRARAAALALAITAPAVLAAASPAFAAGESTAALLSSPASGSAKTFTWSYAFDQDGAHGLSNIAVRFCSADILADVVSAGPSAGVFTSGDVPGGHTGFGPGVKFGVTAPTGTLTVTFAHSHPISAAGLSIQSHSGDGQTGDTVTTAAGPGGCPSDPVATPPGGSTDPSGSAGTGTPSNPTGTDTPSNPAGGDTPSNPSGGDTPSNPSGGDTTPDTGGNGGIDGPDGSANPEPTLIIHSDPAPSNPTPSISTDPAPATTTPPSDSETLVLGETIEKPVVTSTGSDGDGPAVAPAVESAALAHTGSDHAGDLVRFGLGFLGAGVLALTAGGRRRNRSVPSAG
jgi:hypothetical protein